jgi:hypothetical protein
MSTLTTAGTAAPPRALEGPAGISCTDCGLAGGPFDSLAEAAHLAGIHDALHHGSHPTAAVTPMEPDASHERGADLVDDDAYGA